MSESVIYWIGGLALLIGSLRAWHECASKSDGRYIGSLETFSGTVFSKACAALPLLVIGYGVAHYLIGRW
jgi:hypothetical protein